MSRIKITIGSVAVHQPHDAPANPGALRHSLEVSLRKHLSKPGLSWQGRDAHLLRLQAPLPAGASNMGAAISNAVLRALGKGR